MGTNRLGMRPFWVDAIIWEGFWVGMPKLRELLAEIVWSAG